MLYSDSENASILVTTPDYLPKIGGLTTFTVNLEKTLKKLNIEYDLLVWDSVEMLKSGGGIKKKYNLGIHVHFMGGFFLKNRIKRNTNFIHGSEILFYSPLFIKRMAKKFLKRKMLNYFNDSLFNFYISDFTLEKLLSLGHRLSVDRDFVFPNCIEFNMEKFILKDLNTRTLKFVSIARDVPHKNFDGVFKIAKEIALVTGKTVELGITAKDRWSSSVVKITSLLDVEDEIRDAWYKNAHFNLLLSEDHSHRGFFEGFGLTVLEAAKWGTPSLVSGTGGLSESVHDQFTGWHLKDQSAEGIHQWWGNLDTKKYREVSINCYEHSRQSHSLDTLERLLRKVCQ